jgi:hypothetical protein
MFEAIGSTSRNIPKTFREVEPIGSKVDVGVRGAKWTRAGGLPRRWL